MCESHTSHESSTENAHHRYAVSRRSCVVLTLVTIFIGLTWLSFFPQRDSREELLKQGRLALAKSDFQTAETVIRQLLDADSEFAPALYLAGWSAERSGQLNEAIAFYDRIPDNSTPESLKARIAAGDILLKHLKHLTPAEQQFRRAIALDSGNMIAADRLAYILSLETRNWEAQPWQLSMIRHGDVSTRRLYVLCLNDLLHTDPEQAIDYHRTNSDDPGAQLAIAEHAMAERDFEEAGRLLTEIVKSDAGGIESYVKLGRVLLLAGDRQAFLDWHFVLPGRVEEHPGLWVLRGQFANDNGEYETAARCYFEAVERDPCHQQAVYGLGQALVSLGRHGAAKPYLDRARQLQLYSNAVYDARSDQPQLIPEKAEAAADLAAAVSLEWEALAWTFLAERESRSRQGLDSIAWSTTVPGNMPIGRTPDGFRVVSIEEIEDYPLPHWDHTSIDDTNGGTPSSDESHVVFEDVASVQGLDFRYENAADQSITGLGRIYEFTGGGAGVLDFDRDGWPDLYLTQGSMYPPQQKQSEVLDRLFRNQRSQHFADCTFAANCREDRYSQGVSVGDYDSDGFPDVYVANLGENRLYRNNGDGTFQDVSASTGDRTTHWTTSCLVADVNGDTWPDLYAVNYLAGEDLLTRVCRDQSSVRDSCLPVNFPAAPDQLLINNGDGTFKNVTPSCGIAIANGKGLGIVAADFQLSGNLSLFIANDGVPNFFFETETPSPRELPQFTERATIAGLALNRDGRHEACMGIAAADVDNDGRMDLFVTNFTEESNTLYRQHTDHFFIDETNSAGLAEPSFSMLGFGTQFLDADLDGNLDLILTNGHIDDYRATGLMYHMPPQFFRNFGAARFAESTAESLGPFFQETYLGRGMARLDWNRDGREEVVISHIGTPTALLKNLTTNTGNFLSVHLCGIESNRDAIGTTVSVQVDGRTLMRQLVGGSGYQASNEHRLVIGIGKNSVGLNLKVRWPSGLVQELGDVPANSEVVVVEGRNPYVNKPDTN